MTDFSWHMHEDDADTRNHDLHFTDQVGNRNLISKRGNNVTFGERGTQAHFFFFFFYSTLFLKQVKYLNKKHIHFCQIHPCYAFIHIRKRPVFTLIPTSFPEALVRFSTMTVSHVYLKFLYSVIILSLCVCVCMHVSVCLWGCTGA